MITGLILDLSFNECVPMHMYNMFIPMMRFCAKSNNDNCFIIVMPVYRQVAEFLPFSIVTVKVSSPSKPNHIWS